MPPKNIAKDFLSQISPEALISPLEGNSIKNKFFHLQGLGDGITQELKVKDKILFLSDLLIAACEAVTSELETPQIKRNAARVLCMFANITQALDIKLASQKSLDAHQDGYQHIYTSAENITTDLITYIAALNPQLLDKETKDHVRDDINDFFTSKKLEPKDLLKKIQTSLEGMKPELIEEYNIKTYEENQGNSFVEPAVTQERPKPVEQAPTAKAIGQNGQNKNDVISDCSQRFEEVERLHPNPPFPYSLVFGYLVNEYESGRDKEGFPTEKLLQLIGEKESRVKAAAGPVLGDILQIAVPEDGNGNVIADKIDGKAIGTLIKIAKKHPDVSEFSEQLTGFIPLDKDSPLENAVVRQARGDKEIQDYFHKESFNRWAGAGSFTDKLKTFIEINDGERFSTPSEVDHFIVATNDYLGKREPFPGFDPRKSLPWAGRALARTVRNSLPLVGRRSKIYASSGNNPNFFIRKFNEIFRGEVYPEHAWGDQPIASDLVYLYESGLIPETQLKEYLDSLSKRDTSYFANALANRGGIKGWEFDKSIIPIKRKFAPSPAEAVMERLLNKDNIEDGDSAAVQSLTEAMARRSSGPITLLFGGGKLRGLEKKLADYVERLADQSDNIVRRNELKKLIKHLAMDTKVFAQVSAAAAFAIARKSGTNFREELKNVTEYSDLSLSQLALIKDILAEKLVDITSQIDSAPDRKTRNELQEEAKKLRTMLKDVDGLRLDETKFIDIFKNRKEQLALGALLIVVGGPFAVIGLVMAIDAAYNAASISVKKYLNPLIGKAKAKDANNEKETLELGYDAGLISIAAGLLTTLIKGIELGIRKLFGEDVDIREALRKGVGVANGDYGFSLFSPIEAALSLVFGIPIAKYNHYKSKQGAAPGQDSGRGQGNVAPQPGLNQAAATLGDRPAQPDPQRPEAPAAVPKQPAAPNSADRPAGENVQPAAPKKQEPDSTRSAQEKAALAALADDKDVSKAKGLLEELDAPPASPPGGRRNSTAESPRIGGKKIQKKGSDSPIIT
jgi:hypothetical protein